MIISLGFVRSSSQLLVKELDWNQNSLQTRIIDVTDLPDQNLQALFIDDNEHFNSLVGLLEKEKAFYPILDAKDENMTYSAFEALPAQQFKDLYLKTLGRWTMHQNFNSLTNEFINRHPKKSLRFYFRP